MKEIEFPQPMFEHPKKGFHYYYATASNNTDTFQWLGDETDLEFFGYGNCYATREKAAERAAYNKQEASKKIIPKWFRELGPDVEMMSEGKYEELTNSEISHVRDWTKVNPANFRAKPKDVVVNVDGKEFRWPATIVDSDNKGTKYLALNNRNSVEVVEVNNHPASGNFVHYTREGAEQQAAAIRAVAK